ncbi:hypothetical protein [Microvirgula aerodenitrificans]|uniref:hypothetical protein n=1 Tax=Microvirgula aerodenitrificans TaxID=57480 RepID=UPI0012EC15A1|nr:hypothetical protein [Microvirgula aerodenitrificans]
MTNATILLRRDFIGFPSLSCAEHRSRFPDIAGMWQRAGAGGLLIEFVIDVAINFRCFIHSESIKWRAMAMQKWKNVFSVMSSPA